MLFNKKDWYVIYVASVIILFWFAIWSLADDGVKWIEREYGIEPWKVNVAVLVAVLFVIRFDANLFEKL